MGGPGGAGGGMGANPFAGAAGMGDLANNPDAMMQMLNNPMVSQMMEQMTQNPQLMQQMINSNPQLQAMMSDPQSVEKIMNGRALRALPLFAPLSVRCKASRFCSDIISRNAYALTKATSGLALCLVRVSCVYCAQGRSKHRKCQQRSPPPPPTSRI